MRESSVQADFIDLVDSFSMEERARVCFSRSDVCACVCKHVHARRRVSRSPVGRLRGCLLIRLNKAWSFCQNYLFIFPNIDRRFHTKYDVPLYDNSSIRQMANARFSNVFTFSLCVQKDVIRKRLDTALRASVMQRHATFLGDGRLGKCV